MNGPLLNKHVSTFITFVKKLQPTRCYLGLHIYSFQVNFPPCMLIIGIHVYLEVSSTALSSRGAVDTTHFIQVGRLAVRSFKQNTVWSRVLTRVEDTINFNYQSLLQKGPKTNICLLSVPIIQPLLSYSFIFVSFLNLLKLP